MSRRPGGYAPGAYERAANRSGTQPPSRRFDDQHALVGADVCTMRFDILEKLFDHPLTDIGLEQFLKDWEKVPT
jgi:transaldolase